MTDYNLDAESGSFDTDGSDVNLKTVGIGAEFKDNSLVETKGSSIILTLYKHGNRSSHAIERSWSVRN